ncbi:MAG: YhdP family protein [Pseudomonadota bacterium]
MMVLYLLVVLLSVYILTGRYVMTQASDWHEEVEDLLTDAAGMPVRIDHLQGGWQGLQPSLVIEGLRFGEGESAALSLSRASLTIDTLASLTRWQLVAGRIRLRNLELELREQVDGSWQLAGVEQPSLLLSPRGTFELLTRLGDVEILDTRARFISIDQRTLQLDDLAVLFQSRGGRHQLQVDAWRDGDPRRISLSAALRGPSLDTLDGTVHAQLPESELGLFSGLLRRGDVSVGELEAGLELRAELLDSTLVALDLDADLGRLSLSRREPGNAVTLEDLGGRFRYRRSGEQHQLRVDGLRFTREGVRWEPTTGWLDWRNGRQFRLLAETVDVGMLSALLTDSGMASGALLEELQTLDPRGRMHALELEAGLDGSAIGAMSVRGNLDNVRVDPRGMAPAIWGADGYAEFLYAADSGQLRGFVEIDAPDVGLHLPRLFEEPWNYDHVNGRVNVRLDTSAGVDLRVSSSVITATSDLVSGRAQFATTLDAPEGKEPHIGLELMVGALRGDASGKAAYLPTGAAAPRRVQGILEWVDESVREGEVAGSGFIFRGRVQRDARPQERTIQMFYRVRDGALQFDPAWPALENIGGLVVVDGADVDVEVDTGSSLGIGFSETRAEVRANPDGSGSWLTVTGQGQGMAPQGLEYLRRTPVTEGLGDYLAGWQAAGEVDFNLDLQLPLFIEDARPVINLSFGIRDNSVFIPDYELQLDRVNGEVRYSSVDGISSEDFRATAFGNEIGLQLASRDWDSGVNDTVLTASGQVRADALREWPLVSETLDGILQTVEGETGFQLRLELPQENDRGREPGLSVSSDLAGLELDLPAPFSKPREDSWPTETELTFSSQGRTEMQIRVADIVSANARFSGEGVTSGLLFLGPPGDGVRVRRFNEGATGLQVLGRLDSLSVADWFQYQEEHFRMGQEGDLINGLSGLVDVVDVNVDDLDVFGESFRNVNVQLGRDRERMQVSLSSDQLAGTITLPQRADESLIADFSRIHTGSTTDDTDGQAGDVSGESAGSGEEEVRFEELDTVEYVMPRTDPLENVDPLVFPAMVFSVSDLRMDGAEFGRWAFTMVPRDDGVALDDLVIESRGLQVGTSEDPARFVWQYDGRQHESRLEGSIVAADLAPVLEAFGYAPVLESGSARFDTRLEWDGSPAFVSAVGVRGEVDLALDDGRFRSGAGAGNSALKLISIINFDALVRRLRFSDDLLREGLAYEEIRGRVFLDEGIVTIQDRLQIIGPSSLFQLSGSVNLSEQTIDGNLYITLPVSDNLPWVSGLAALNNLINWQVAVGVFVLDQIFGDQVDNLTSAQYSLQGPWETLEPRLTQAFTTGDEEEGNEPATDP